MEKLAIPFSSLKSIFSLPNVTSINLLFSSVVEFIPEKLHQVGLSKESSSFSQERKRKPNC